MAIVGLHEDKIYISKKTRDLHRAPVSQQEELEAVDSPAIIEHHAGTAVLGQDMRMSYAGSDGINYQLFVCESMVLRLDEAEAVCVMAD